jgi:hypothetical protein
MADHILDAFLDGFTGAGLYEKLKPPGRPDQFRQVMTASTCGFIAVVVVLLGFVYLIMHNHPIVAGVLIGTLYLGHIVRIVRTVRRRNREG